MTAILPLVSSVQKVGSIADDLFMPKRDLTQHDFDVINKQSKSYKLFNYSKTYCKC